MRGFLHTLPFIVLMLTCPAYVVGMTWAFGGWGLLIAMITLIISPPFMHLFVWSFRHWVDRKLGYGPSGPTDSPY